VSLILDALRKLERDKQARDPGVVVVGQVPWRGRDRSRGATRAILGVLTLLVLAGAWTWLARPHGGAPATHPTERSEPLSTEAAAPRAAEPSTASPTPAELPAPTAPNPAPQAPPHREVALPEPEPAPPPGMVEGPGPAETAPASGPPVEPPSIRPPVPTPRPPLLLTAISERDGKPVAVLNDRIVHEGDSIDGIRVLRIGPTEVEVEVDGRREVIRF